MSMFSFPQSDLDFLEVMRLLRQHTGEPASMVAIHRIGASDMDDIRASPQTFLGLLQEGGDNVHHLTLSADNQLRVDDHVIPRGGAMGLLRDAASYLRPAARSPVVRYYAALLHDPTRHVTEVPTIFAAMLHDAQFFSVVEDSPYAAFGETLRTASSLWWTTYARQILEAPAAGAGTSQAPAENEEKGREGSKRGDASGSSNTPSSDGGCGLQLSPAQRAEGIEAIRAVLTLVIALSAPYRLTRPPHAPMTSCTARLMLCEDPSVVYLGLLLNSTHRTLPEKVMRGTPVLQVIAHGWGSSPSLKDIVEANWRLYLHAKAQAVPGASAPDAWTSGAGAGGGVSADDCLQLRVPSDPTTVVPRERFSHHAGSHSAELDLERVARVCLTSMAASSGDAVRCLWWARCRLLSFAALSVPAATGVLSGSAASFFSEVWSAEELFTTVLQEVPPAASGADDKNAAAARHAQALYTNLIGVIADAAHCWCLAQSSGLARLLPVTADTAGHPLWHRLNATLPHSPHFRREYYASYEAFWQVGLLVDHHITHVVSLDPTRNGVPAVAQLTELLQRQPEYYPALLARTLGLTTKRALTTAALSSGLVRSLTTVLFYYLPKLPPPPSGAVMKPAGDEAPESAPVNEDELDTSAVAPAPPSTRQYAERTVPEQVAETIALAHVPELHMKSYTAIVTALKVLRRCVVQSLHPSANPMAFLLTPDEQHDGVALCTPLHALARQTRYASLSVAALLAFTDFAHYNVRDLVPALVERGLARTALEITDRPLCLVGEPHYNQYEQRGVRSLELCFASRAPTLLSVPPEGPYLNAVLARLAVPVFLQAMTVHNATHNIFASHAHWIRAVLSCFRVSPAEAVMTEQDGSVGRQYVPVLSSSGAGAAAPLEAARLSQAIASLAPLPPSSVALEDNSSGSARHEEHYRTALQNSARNLLLVLQTLPDLFPVFIAAAAEELDALQAALSTAATSATPPLEMEAHLTSFCNFLCLVSAAELNASRTTHHLRSASSTDPLFQLHHAILGAVLPALSNIFERVLQCTKAPATPPSSPTGTATSAAAAAPSEEAAVILRALNPRVLGNFFLSTPPSGLSKFAECVEAYMREIVAELSSSASRELEAGKAAALTQLTEAIVGASAQSPHGGTNFFDNFRMSVTTLLADIFVSMRGDAEAPATTAAVAAEDGAPAAEAEASPMRYEEDALLQEPPSPLLGEAPTDAETADGNEAGDIAALSSPTNTPPAAAASPCLAKPVDPRRTLQRKLHELFLSPNARGRLPGTRTGSILPARLRAASQLSYLYLNPLPILSAAGDELTAVARAVAQASETVKQRHHDASRGRSPNEEAEDEAAEHGAGGDVEEESAALAAEQQQAGLEAVDLPLLHRAVMRLVVLDRSNYRRSPWMRAPSWDNEITKQQHTLAQQLEVIVTVIFACAPPTATTDPAADDVPRRSGNDSGSRSHMVAKLVLHAMLSLLRLPMSISPRGTVNSSGWLTCKAPLLFLLFNVMPSLPGSLRDPRLYVTALQQLAELDRNLFASSTAVDRTSSTAPPNSPSALPLSNTGATSSGAPPVHRSPRLQWLSPSALVTQPPADGAPWNSLSSSDSTAQVSRTVLDYARACQSSRRRGFTRLERPAQTPEHVSEHILTWICSTCCGLFFSLEKLSARGRRSLRHATCRLLWTWWTAMPEPSRRAQLLSCLAAPVLANPREGYVLLEYLAVILSQRSSVDLNEALARTSFPRAVFGRVRAAVAELQADPAYDGREDERRHLRKCMLAQLYNFVLAFRSLRRGHRDRMALLCPYFNKPHGFCWMGSQCTSLHAVAPRLPPGDAAAAAPSSLRSAGSLFDDVLLDHTQQRALYLLVELAEMYGYTSPPKPEAPSGQRGAEEASADAPSAEPSAEPACVEGDGGLLVTQAHSSRAREHELLPRLLLMAIAAGSYSNLSSACAADVLNAILQDLLDPSLDAPGAPSTATTEPPTEPAAPSRAADSPRSKREEDTKATAQERCLPEIVCQLVADLLSTTYGTRAMHADELTRWTDPERLMRLCAYLVQDVVFRFTSAPVIEALKLLVDDGAQASSVAYRRMRETVTEAVTSGCAQRLTAESYATLCALHKEAPSPDVLNPAVDDSGRSAAAAEPAREDPPRHVVPLNFFLVRLEPELRAHPHAFAAVLEQCCELRWMVDSASPSGPAGAQIGVWVGPPPPKTAVTPVEPPEETSSAVGLRSPAQQRRRQARVVVEQLLAETLQAVNTKQLQRSCLTALLDGLADQPAVLAALSSPALVVPIPSEFAPYAITGSVPAAALLCSASAALPGRSLSSSFKECATRPSREGASRPAARARAAEGVVGTAASATTTPGGGGDHGASLPLWVPAYVALALLFCGDEHHFPSNMFKAVAQRAPTRFAAEMVVLTRAVLEALTAAPASRDSAHDACAPSDDVAVHHAEEHLQELPAPQVASAGEDAAVAATVASPPRTTLARFLCVVLHVLRKSLVLADAAVGTRLCEELRQLGMLPLLYAAARQRCCESERDSATLLYLLRRLLLASSLRERERHQPTAPPTSDEAETAAAAAAAAVAGTAAPHDEAGPADDPVDDAGGVSSFSAERTAGNAHYLSAGGLGGADAPVPQEDRLLTPRHPFTEAPGPAAQVGDTFHATIQYMDGEDEEEDDPEEDDQEEEDDGQHDDDDDDDDAQPQPPHEEDGEYMDLDWEGGEGLATPAGDDALAEAEPEQDDEEIVTYSFPAAVANANRAGAADSEAPRTEAAAEGEEGDDSAVAGERDRPDVEGAQAAEASAMTGSHHNARSLPQTGEDDSHTAFTRYVADLGSVEAHGVLHALSEAEEEEEEAEPERPDDEDAADAEGEDEEPAEWGDDDAFLEDPFVSVPSAAWEWDAQESGIGPFRIATGGQRMGHTPRDHPSRGYLNNFVAGLGVGGPADTTVTPDAGLSTLYIGLASLLGIQTAANSAEVCQVLPPLHAHEEEEAATPVAERCPPASSVDAPSALPDAGEPSRNDPEEPRADSSSTSSTTRASSRGTPAPPSAPGTPPPPGGDAAQRVLDLFAAADAAELPAPARSTEPPSAAPPSGAAAAPPPTEPTSAAQPWVGSVDPLFLVGLPEDMRSEIAFNTMELIRGGVEYERLGQHTSILPGFMDQMPEEVQRSVMDTEQRWLRVTGNNAGAPASAAGGVGTSALLEILLSVEDDVRRDVLLTCNLDDLRGHPALLEEAEQARAAVRAEEQRRTEEAAARASAVNSRSSPRRVGGAGGGGAMRGRGQHPWMSVMRGGVAADHPSSDSLNADALPGSDATATERTTPPEAQRHHLRRRDVELLIREARLRAASHRLGRRGHRGAQPAAPAPPTAHSPYHSHALHLPEVPVDVLQACVKLLHTEPQPTRSPLSAPADRRRGEVSLMDTQLTALLRSVCADEPTAAMVLSVLLDCMEASVAASPALDSHERRSSSSGARPERGYAFHVLRVFVDVVRSTRSAAMALVSLPDGARTSATMKPVDAPLDAVEAALVQRCLLGRLARVTRSFADSKSFQDEFGALLLHLTQLMDRLEEVDVAQTGDDPLLDQPLSDAIIDFPRHCHRLAWVDVRQIRSYLSGGYICNVCGLNPKEDGHAFHCDLCNFDLCPGCSRVRLTEKEEHERLRRWAYYTFSAPGVLPAFLALLRDPHCSDVTATLLVRLASRGVRESARRDGDLARSSSPICVVEDALVRIARVFTEEIRQCRREFKEDVGQLLARAETAAAAAEQPAGGHASSSTSTAAAATTTTTTTTASTTTAPLALVVPENIDLTLDQAIVALHRMSLVKSVQNKSQLFLLPYAETHRPEPREVALMWHAAQAYLQDITQILQHLPEAMLVPLPLSVLTLMSGFCQYHLSESRGANASASSSGLVGHGLLGGETERFMLESSLDPSVVSDKAARDVRSNARKVVSAMANDRDRPEERRRLPRVVRKFLEANRPTLNALLRWDANLLSDTFSFLRSEPNLMDFAFKLRDFRRRIDIRRGARVSINVDRARCLEDSFHELKKVTAFNGPLQVRFRGEEGADAGGLTREWFQLLAAAMVNEDYALFIHSREGLTYQPNPLSFVNRNHLEYFSFAGVVIGLAIANNVPMDIHFTRAVYRHMVGVQPTFQDLESVDPELYANLRWMLTNDVTDLALTMAVNYECFGAIQEEELVPHGKDTVVTNANKLQYVRLLCQFHMTKRIEPQLTEFLKGLYTVLPRHGLRCFSEQELELVICGLPDIDVEDLRAHTVYEGYTASSPQVRWFWEAVAAMTKEDQANLLQFATGASKVPPGGFSNLESSGGQRQHFTISRWEGSGELLPQAHTCFNKIDLPEYPSSEALREKLMLAITFGSMGFTMI